MRKQLITYSIITICSVVFLSACSGGGEKSKETVELQKISGAEILEDAKTYAEQQCYFKYQEKLLNDDPNVQDYDLTMKTLKREKKKAKNFYRKKYKDLETEWVAFQRAVKAARRDSEYCIKVAKGGQKE